MRSALASTCFVAASSSSSPGRGVELCVGVEQRQMRQRIEQCLMFVLPVQFDEALREVAECARRGECAVDERSAASLAGDLAADDELTPACPERRRGIGVLEERLDGGLRLTRADEIG